MQILSDESHAARSQMQIVAANAASGVTKMQIAPDDWRRIPAIAFFCNATVRSRSGPHGGTSLASPHAAAGPRLRRDLPRVPLAGSGGIQHRCRGVRPLGGSRARQACHCRGRRRRPGARRQLRLAARYFEPARQRARGAMASRRGDRVAILLPQAPEVAAIHIAIYKLGAIALPLAMLFGTEAICLPAAELRRQGADHQRAGARQGRCAANCRACN